MLEEKIMICYTHKLNCGPNKLDIKKNNKKKCSVNIVNNYYNFFVFNAVHFNGNQNNFEN